MIDSFFGFPLSGKMNHLKIRSAASHWSKFLKMKTRGLVDQKFEILKHEIFDSFKCTQTKQDMVNTF